MATKPMFFFERNSFVLRQLLHPGWVKSRNVAAVAPMFAFGGDVPAGYFAGWRRSSIDVDREAG
ncbi:MAG: hypothetical protein A3H35_18245 [Betaproteobacteria bacterium RIFCSPLOWO2_02_FULL_62_17]|nr:MAG: hypothetical protein A3H35_18245 [Betaproteobacteria bacterium RIFCSPLOWO2_02_FULL_62_17]